MYIKMMKIDSINMRKHYINQTIEAIQALYLGVVVCVREREREKESERNNAKITKKMWPK